MSLDGHAVVDRTFDSSGNVSNEFPHIFVFPKLIVKKGEYIKLFSGEGKYSNYQAVGKITVHCLYWHADSCVWNDNGGDAATFIKYSVINSAEVPSTE
jgi:hypothetical protein